MKKVFWAIASLGMITVTEGEDKPLKYPTIFNSADVALITKTDLAQAVEFDEESAKANIQAVRPGMPHFAVSAKTGAGLSEYLEFLALQLTESAQRTPV
jgi:hydrogenase nickel incorporation protein HypB